MKKILFTLLLTTMVQSQETTEKFQPLPFGSIHPKGWLKKHMQTDLDGFVGHLDILVPNLFNDPIYGTGRLQKSTAPKDLGNLKSGDAVGEEQYKWWNSETQSNWWDGYIRHVFLVNDTKGKAKVTHYIKRILATQDEDGYLGIYDTDLRYKFTSENGELWAKATLLRGLLAYYEYTQDTVVFNAIERAVLNVMKHYPINNSSPFSTGTSFNGGVSHGLTFTDVLERLYFHTQKEIYRDYALFLYQDFSATYQSEGDVQLSNILNPDYKLQSHGVHTFEHLRALLIAKYASKNETLSQALTIYVNRIKKVITLSGGAIGDEWIAKREADETHTGYEYCSLQELVDSYGMLFQKTGEASLGDDLENIFYNAAQGSRHPEKSCIAYLKTDNSYEMLGTKNGEIEPDRKQTRYKYSPAHQDVAVCCNPNAGRIAPYFLQYSWMKENENTLVATLLMPNRVSAVLNGKPVSIENETMYPYKNEVAFKITQPNASTFTLKIRKPHWVTHIITKEPYRIDGEFIVIERLFKNKDIVALTFETSILMQKSKAGGTYFTYGALLFAKPIMAKEYKGKTYFSKFCDYMYEPLLQTRYQYVKGVQPQYKNGNIEVNLLNTTTREEEAVILEPIGKTILRQVTF